MSDIFYVDIDELVAKKPLLNDFLTTYAINNNIDVDKISQSEMSKNICMKNKDSIIYNYKALVSEDVNVKICVKDIIGLTPYDYLNNIFEILDKTYQEPSYKKSYESRSSKFLSLPIDEMIESIKTSTSFDTICLNTYGDETYEVSSNGCHRVVILKLLYINELLTSGKPVEEINNKYTIECKVKNYDRDLTYMKYILTRLNVIEDLSSERDEATYKLTGRYILETPTIDEKRALTKDEFINYFNEFISSPDFVIDDDFEYELKIKCSTIPLFNEFIIKNIPSLKYVIKEEQNAGN